MIKFKEFEAENGTPHFIVSNDILGKLNFGNYLGLVGNSFSV